MARKSALEAGLEAMAQDFALPGGGKLKIARLVRAHLDWFDLAAEHGLTWLDISRALAGVGITDQSGKALSFGTITAAVWRARDLRDQAPASIQKSKPPTARLAASKKTQPAHSKPQPKQKKSALPNPSQNARNKPAASNKDVLRYMQRAAALRKDRDL